MNRPRWLCGWFGHPGSVLYLDRFGEAMVTNCMKCRSLKIQALEADLEREDYERILDECLEDGWWG